MALRAKNKPLTAEQRIALANESVGTALFVFEQAAVTLESARDDQYQIADDLDAEVQALLAEAERLSDLAGQVAQSGDKAGEQADNLRALLNIA